MMLTTPKLRVIHVTTHIGLIDAVAAIDPPRVERVIRLGHAALADSPRIAVCGINPHAGENGLFGNGEEAEKIEPAVAAAVADGIDVTGPLPADTAFFRAVRGDFDLVVAMYHDQGHGPIKVLGLDEGVNVTVGLPVIRTSVDHGTAFDIAGPGRRRPRQPAGRAARGRAAEPEPARELGRHRGRRGQRRPVRRARRARARRPRARAGEGRRGVVGRQLGLHRRRDPDRARRPRGRARPRRGRRGATPTSTPTRG